MSRGTRPMILMRLLVTEATNPGELVRDPFCGSGTNCLAASQAGRHYLGAERHQVFAHKARLGLDAG